jgi:hypothetical protein
MSEDTEGLFWRKAFEEEQRRADKLRMDNEELKLQLKTQPKVLHLTLKRKWFDMIEAKIKPEEYREIKPFWIKRLCQWYRSETEFKPLDFDATQFYNGWACSTKYPNYQIECRGIEIREGKPEWGAEPGKKYFVIKLGERIA